MNEHDLLKTNYDVGDIVTCGDTSSILFRRECIVVYSDPVMFAVITEGVRQVVSLQPNEPTIRLLEKGVGVLDEAQRALLTDVVQQWDCTKFLKALPPVIEHNRKVMDVKGDERINIQLAGFVPKDVAFMWKEFRMMTDLVKETDPTIPNHIQTMVLEWVLTQVLSQIKLIAMHGKFNVEE